MDQLQREWADFIVTNADLLERNADETWRRFKAAHGFTPNAFIKRPPWCVAGAGNNKWAAQAFLGDARRESAWANAGYFDRPFHFACLWLDLAGFSGLLGESRLPYAERATPGQLKREARKLAKSVRAVSAQIATWPFLGVLDMENVIRPSDYGNSITIPASAGGFTPAQRHSGVQLMLAGARQQILLPLAGRGSVLDRVAEVLTAWTPPESLIDRPNRPAARSRFAARWLDKVLGQLGGEIPATARYQLIAELVQILGELGKWEDDVWTEERVRRCLDGKSVRKRRDSV